MNSLQKVLYTAEARVTGGRTGRVQSDDGCLDLPLSLPEVLGGEGGFGSNPEQLFAAAYGACFLNVLKRVGRLGGEEIPAGASVAAEVSIGPVGGGFGIAVKLDVSLPGMDETRAKTLVAKCHAVCPYSNATRENIPVEISVNVD